MTENIEINEEYNHSYSQEKNYVKPQDKALLDQLEWFSDQKLGLMMHWGPYSQWGCIESWPLSDEDSSWSREKDILWTTDAEFKKAYWNLNKTFNPVRFDPQKWAEAALEGGFKYLLFTTKHHDGFCMWDTEFSDYKITSPDCPYHTNKNADICKNLFDAFREKGLPICAYFSKADWHSPYYWENEKKIDGFTTRNTSYDTEKNPELWEKFIQYTKAQILELVKKYGRLESLWFDAGQVSPSNKQDIRLSEIMAEARKIQPWILSVDRTVGGINENYITPEQTVPPKPLNVPWESCVTLGDSFSFKYDDNYKSPQATLRLLIDIVAKGGNLALNIGPQPDGRISQKALEVVKSMGKWLKANGEAIYNTRVCPPYRIGDFAYTQNKHSAFAIYMGGENNVLKGSTQIPFEKKATAISFEGKPLEFEQTDKMLTLKLKHEIDANYPVVFKIIL